MKLKFRIIFRCVDLKWIIWTLNIEQCNVTNFALNDYALKSKKHSTKERLRELLSAGLFLRP